MATKARVKIEREHKKQTPEVREVRTTHDPDEANRLLASGWNLLHGGIGHVDSLGYNVKPTFVLGRIG